MTDSNALCTNHLRRLLSLDFLIWHRMKMCITINFILCNRELYNCLETIPYALTEANTHKAIISSLKVQLSKEKPLYYIKAVCISFWFSLPLKFCLYVWLAFLNKTGNNYYKIQPEQRLHR